MICEGLAKARTDSEYRTLVDMITSRPKPHVALETREIQSLVLRGMGNLKVTGLIAFNFPTDDRAAISTWLADLSGRSPTPAHRRASFDTRIDYEEDLAINVALSPSGLKRLRLGEIHHVHKDLPSDAYSSLPAAFRSGMTSQDRQKILGDRNHQDWEWGGDGEPDAVLMLYARDQALLDTVFAEELAALTANGFTIVKQMKTQPLGNPHRELFGFVDGVSQPVIKGTVAANATHNALHVVEPGEIVLGYRDNTEYYPTSPLVNALAPGASALPSLPEQVADDFPAFGTDPATQPRDLGKNGTFLVIRQLEQDRQGFAEHLEDQAARARATYGLSYINSDWLGAKIMGRWKDGSSLVQNPHEPKTGYLGNKNPGFNPVTDDNAFRLGTEDPQGQACPFGAHIRRANPRDSQKPGGDGQIDLTNRHRILRRARVYSDPETGKEGLLFMCLNANLERQFEFVQQTWMNATRFHGLRDEYDSIAGGSAQAQNTLTIPTASGPIQIRDLQSFVTMKGGGYFFMPSRSALRFFSDLVVS